MDLLCGLSITEGHGGQIFKDRHFHRAVTTIKQRHQGARVHRPIHDLGTNTCRGQKRREERRGVNNLCLLGTKWAAGRDNHTHSLCTVALIIAYLSPAFATWWARQAPTGDMDTSSFAAIHTVTRQQVLSPHEVIIAIIPSPCRGTSMSACVCVCMLNPCLISSDLESHFYLLELFGFLTYYFGRISKTYDQRTSLTVVWPQCVSLCVKTRQFCYKVTNHFHM